MDLYFPHAMRCVRVPGLIVISTRMKHVTRCSAHGVKWFDVTAAVGLVRVVFVGVMFLFKEHEILKKRKKSF